MDTEPIKKIVGRGNYLETESDKQPFLTGWRGGWQGNSPLVCLPESVEKLQELVRYCHEHHIPMVPQGGNTGLTGGSVPDSSGEALLISLSRLNKIRNLNLNNMTIEVEAGAVLQDVQALAAAENLLFPVAMASEGSCQVGGIISTNAGGIDVLRYGTTRQLCLGLEVVLPDGKLLPMLSGLRKDNTGYDLKQLFIGAEGTLGFVTAATFRLFPAIKQRQTMLLAIHSIADVLDVFSIIQRQCGELLSACEVMHSNALNLVEKHLPDMQRPFAEWPQWVLLVELATSCEFIDLRMVTERLVAQWLEGGQVLDGVMAESEAQRRTLWAWRENITESARAEGVGVHCDISVPIDALPEFLQLSLEKISDAHPEALPFPFGHFGDGNIHFNFLFSKEITISNLSDVRQSINNITNDFLNHFGGSISAEHGIGRERAEMLPKVKAPEELALMNQLKRMIDPFNLMNPAVMLLPQK